MSGLLLEYRYEKIRDEWNDAPMSVDHREDSKRAVHKVHCGQVIAHLESTPGWSDQIDLHSEDGSFLILKGEVFTVNGRRLERTELAKNLSSNLRRIVSSENDDELSSFITSLNGSFLIAFSANRGSDLIVATDKFASHHAFYTSDPADQMVVATSASAVASFAKQNVALDRAALACFIMFQRLIGEQTLYSGIRYLKPGHILRIRDGSYSVIPYFHYRFRPDTLGRQEAAHEIARVFKQSFLRRIRPEEKLGLLLSGGLDARMVLACSDSPIECFHFNDSKNQEFRSAKAISEVHGSAFNFLKRCPSHYSDLLESAVKVADGAFAFGHAHTIGLEDKITETGVDVLFHGFAPELYFRGTSLPHLKRTYFGKFVQTYLDRSTNCSNLREKMLRKLKYSLHDEGAFAVFSAKFLGEAIDHIDTALNTIVNEARESSDDVFDQFLWLDTFYNSRYPSSLFQLHLREYVRERSVVYDDDVLDLYLTLPIRLKADSRAWIEAIRILNPKIAACVDANTGLSPLTPPPIATLANVTARGLSALKRITRPSDSSQNHFSEGSWPHFNEYLQNDECLQRKFRSYISAGLSSEFFDREKVLEMLESHVQRRAMHWNILQACATFGAWNRLCMV
jgi:asparagine synthase (glutamine-hydrolysing)